MSVCVNKVCADIKSIANLFLAVARVMSKDYTQHLLVVLGDSQDIFGKCSGLKLCVGSGVLTYHGRIRQVSLAILCG